MSLPTRERELKLTRIHSPHSDLTSLPTRERELKLDQAFWGAFYDSRSPRGSVN